MASLYTVTGRTQEEFDTAQFLFQKRRKQLDLNSTILESVASNPLAMSADLDHLSRGNYYKKWDKEWRGNKGTPNLLGEGILIIYQYSNSFVINKLLGCHAVAYQDWIIYDSDFMNLYRWDEYIKYTESKLVHLTVSNVTRFN
jgi:hypothetical protein